MIESIWSRTAAPAPRPPLTGEETAQAAIIGGGLAGVLTAWLLRQEGIDAAIVEAEQIGGGQTSGTTAKFTSQHGAVYHRLAETLGADAAGRYAQANQEAIHSYEALIQARSIPCQWRQCRAWLYSRSDESLIQREAEAEKRAGLSVTLSRRTELPFPVKAALAAEGQAAAHPLALLFALAEDLRIYENSRVLAVEDGQLRTAKGTLRAETMIFTCHYPFVNFPGLYFARMHQERSYVLALSGAGRMEDMYYGVDQGGLSFRPAGELLLLGGESHRAGENASGGQYQALSQAARLLYPSAQETARWSAQDCVTADGLPYIGRFSAGKPRWYVATGFAKWGMTTSMAAARLLRDLVLGRANPYEDLFSPQRHTLLLSAPQLAQEGLHAVKGLGRQLFAPARQKAEALAPGQGGVVEAAGKKLGVCRTPEGALLAVDIRCPHLGCQLAWNPEERTWDCPCHGSRFDLRGRLLTGPAQQDLTAWEL